ncbi:MAG: hypothetical protein ACO1SX_12145 [Actinomycetota bacterium]
MTRGLLIALGILLLGWAAVVVLIDAFLDVKKSPREAVCRSNLKQMATALMIYSEDYDRRLPPTGYAVGAEAVALPSLMYPYIKSGDIWACPTAVKDGARDHTFDGTPGDTTVSLGYNGSALAPNRIGVPLDAAKHPEGTVAFVDTSYYLATPASLAPALGGSPPAYRHRERANVAWLDGHAKAVSKEVLEATAEVEGDKPLTAGIDRFLRWNLK